MEVVRSSDLLSKQSVVSKQPYCLICADDKLGCSWTTQGINDISALGVQSSTALIPSLATVITMGHLSAILSLTAPATPRYFPSLQNLEISVLGLLIEIIYSN